MMKILKVILFCLILIASLQSLASSPTPSESWDLARTRYQEKDFASFFAIAQWVRARYEKQMSESEMDQWLALELMGLSHHCSWQEIQSLVLAHQPLGALSSEAMKYIELKSEYQRFKNDPSSGDLTLTEKFKKRRSQWKISYEQFKQVSDPKNLRVEVASRCE